MNTSASSASLVAFCIAARGKDLVWQAIRLSTFQIVVQGSKPRDMKSVNWEIVWLAAVCVRLIPQMTWFVMVYYLAFVAISNATENRNWTLYSVCSLSWLFQTDGKNETETEANIKCPIT